MVGGLDDITVQRSGSPSKTAMTGGDLGCLWALPRGIANQDHLCTTCTCPGNSFEVGGIILPRCVSVEVDVSWKANS